MLYIYITTAEVKFFNCETKSNEDDQHTARKKAN